MGYFPDDLVEKARESSTAREALLSAASPWLAMSFDDLYGLMFGNTITRSWMVWSNGHCPSCRAGVPMYEWVIRALELRFKVRCPKCAAVFPTNDFEAFYRSGMDGGGVFRPEKADRSLLFNAGHPEPDDPLRRFGVDDGEGFVQDGLRWRFIGAYLIYGQWKQLVLGGVKTLSDAWIASGEPSYARRAGIILYRVADLYPSHDFEREGLAYEKAHGSGYVSTWHDACAEARMLALAYDAVRGELERDGELAAWLAERLAGRLGSRSGSPNGSPNGRSISPAEVCRHIEEGILRDTLANTPKITSNFPQTDITRMVILNVLGGDREAAQSEEIAHAMVEKATAVDGVTGEKGMTAYTAGAVGGMADFLALEERRKPGYLASALSRHPRLADMFRFHVDTWCLGRFYPNVGDSAHVGERTERYAGVELSPSPDLGPSMYSFLHLLGELTGDPAYDQIIYRANGYSTDGLPYDLFARDPEGFHRSVRQTIDREGARIPLGSVRKDAWRITVLRSGSRENERAAWVSSRVGGGHHHFDGMNLGLYARGLDLLPDFGYPPVNYGGWGSAQAQWYRASAAHNTVVIDGTEQREGSGSTTLWYTGREIQAVRIDGAGMAASRRFERTVALVDVSEESFYLLDVFRVEGGREHSYLLHSSFGSVTPRGFAPRTVPEPEIPPWLRSLPLRGFRAAPPSPDGFSVEWLVEDRFGYLRSGETARLRASCLSPDVEAWLAEAWVSVSGYRNEVAWIPELIMRRSGPSPLSSCFVALLEPYGRAPSVRAARRLEAGSESSVAVEVELADGRRDVILLADEGSPLREAGGVRTDAELCFVRHRGAEPLSFELAKGSRLEAAGLSIRLPGRSGSWQLGPGLQR